MTKEEISRFAFMITYVGTQTEVILKNGHKLTGFFDSNDSNNDLHNQNKWNFVSFSQTNQGALILLEGDQVDNITITLIADQKADFDQLGI